MLINNHFYSYGRALNPADVKTLKTLIYIKENPIRKERETIW
jgi:hypothetical protein